MSFPRNETIDESIQVASEVRKIYDEGVDWTSRDSCQRFVIGSSKCSSIISLTTHIKGLFSSCIGWLTLLSSMQYGQQAPQKSSQVYAGLPYHLWTSHDYICFANDIFLIAHWTDAYSLKHEG